MSTVVMERNPKMDEAVESGAQSFLQIAIALRFLN